MSPLIALWIASAIGAVLFFSSGFLLSRSGRRAAEPSAEHELESTTLAARTEAAEQAHREELHQLRSALFASEQQQQRLRGESERALEQARLHYDRLKEQLASAPPRSQPPSSRREIEELNQRFAQAQKVAAGVPTLRSKLGELERALTQTAAAAKTSESRVRVLEGELRQLQGEALQKPDLKAKEARILHLESQLGEAQSNLDRLQGQLSAQVDSANAALLTDVKRLNEEQQERALRIKMLTARVAELEAYAEQNAALRGERDGLRGELERLKGASEGPPRAPRAEPRALVDVNKAADHAKPAQSGTKRRVNDSELTLEFSLKQNLSHLMTREPNLIAVVSDDNGFPVAGVGSEHSQEGVSVLTSLAQELALRVNEFVDLDRIERMELADVAGRALRVRFFDWEAQPLALGCLGKRSLVSNQDEETVVATFPKLLRRAWSA